MSPSAALAAIIDDVLPLFNIARDDGLTLRESYISMVDVFEEPHFLGMKAYKRRKPLAVTVHDSDSPNAALKIVERSEAVLAEQTRQDMLATWGTLGDLESNRFKVLLESSKLSNAELMILSLTGQSPKPPRAGGRQGRPAPQEVRQSERQEAVLREGRHEQGFRLRRARQGPSR